MAYIRARGFNSMCPSPFKAEKATRKFQVTVSMFEIYNEALFDLLDPKAGKGAKPKGLDVRTTNPK